MSKKAILLMIVLGGCSGIRSRYHTVRAGEDLASLAHQYDIPLNSLVDNNGDRLRGGLKAGIRLYLPFEDSPLWEDPDQLGLVVRKPAAVDLEKATFSWPIRGPISSHFGARKRHGRWGAHEGVDIVARGGNPVRAARSGHVIYAASRISGYGNMVIIRHPDAYATVYAHLSGYAVKKGQYVSRGQLLGRVGRTGRATDNHLHFEIRNNRHPVDPMPYLGRRFVQN